MAFPVSLKTVISWSEKWVRRLEGGLEGGGGPVGRGEWLLQGGKQIPD